MSYLWRFSKLFSRYRPSLCRNVQDNFDTTFYATKTWCQRKRSLNIMCANVWHYTSSSITISVCVQLKFPISLHVATLTSALGKTSISIHISKFWYCMYRALYIVINLYKRLYLHRNIYTWTLVNLLHVSARHNC